MINRILLLLMAIYIFSSIFSVAKQIICWDEFLADFKIKYSEKVTEEGKLAIEYSSYFLSKDYESFRSKMSEDLLKQLSEADFTKISEYFSAQKPIAVDVVGANTFQSPELWRGNFTLQYGFPDRWLLFVVNLIKKEGNDIKVEGIRVQPIRSSLQSLNKFHLIEKPILNYVFLAVTVIVPIIIITTIVICAFSPIENKKWAWLLFIFLGLIRFNLDWTTGGINFSPLAFQLLGSGYSISSPYAPVVLMFSIPIGSIIFLLKRKSLINDKLVKIE